MELHEAPGRIPLFESQQMQCVQMLKKMKSISFEGKSGVIKLDESGDVFPASTAFTNYRFPSLAPFSTEQSISVSQQAVSRP